MDRDSPDHSNPDPARHPRSPRRPDRPPSANRSDPSASDFDPEQTRPMPAEPPGRRGGPAPGMRAGRLSDADLPPDSRSPAPPPQRGGRLVRGQELPATPRWALPHDRRAATPPAAPPRANPPPAAPRKPGPPPEPPIVSRAEADRSAAPEPAYPPSWRRRRMVAAPLARSRRPWRRGTRVAAGLLALVLVGLCGYLGWIVFRVQQVATDWFVTPPPRPAGVAAFPDWSKQERVNILLMGLDTREPGNSRSDTLILVSVDPAHKTAAMISIPRDLWVTIPGNDSNRINAAYQFGENTGVAGGGPALEMQTVEQNFGVPVHYYAQVDFQGFRRIVDALGGVTIDVQRPLIDNEYPADYGFAFQRVYIPAGLQHMDGRTALQYVRSRHADSDLGRNERQQGMLLALRDEATQLSILGKLDQVLTEAKGALRTDLSFTQAGSLAKLAQGIPRDQIRQLAIGGDMVSNENINGADVLVPHWDLIRPAIQDLLGGADLKTESAAISVMNGTDTAGLAGQNAELLRNAGLDVPDAAVGNPPDGGAGRYPQTYVIDYTNGQKPASLTEILSLLKLPADRVRKGDAGARPSGIDFVVMIGEDLAK